MKESKNEKEKKEQQYLKTDHRHQWRQLLWEEEVAAAKQKKEWKGQEITETEDLWEAWWK